MPRNRRPQTVQAHQKVDADAAGPISLPMSFFSAGGIAPDWDAIDRDKFLRTFWKQFGNDMLAAVLATSVAKIQTQNWEIEGPETIATMYQRMLRDAANFGAGWDDLLSRGVQDYYTQDNGWFMERQRSGARDWDGPMLGLAHLDSARMRPTGNSEFPYIYTDIHGKDHLMHRSQYIRIVDMPTPHVEFKSQDKGFCALSRALSTAIILTLLVTMKREKLSDLPPSAIAVFNNINRNQFETALKLYSSQEDMKANVVWRQLMPLFGIDPAHPANIQFVSLREVWEGFDDMTAMNIAAYSFAAAWRIDPREFWPVSQGPLGTGKEAEVQHQKAKAKSTGLLFTQIERAFNSSVSLPDSLSFRFALQDADEEQQRAAIHSMQVSNVKAMQEAGAGLTPEELRWLFAVQYRIIPRTMSQAPKEGEAVPVSDIYLDDVERQAKEFGGWWFGPMVRVDSQGGKVYLSKREQRLYLLPAPTWVGDKGGTGSGNWGHAGRPGQVGGSSAASAGQRRLDKTLERVHKASVARQERLEKREQQQQAAAAAEAKRMTEEPELPEGVYHRESDIPEGEYGRGYFINPDGDLVDITSDFGGGTNDHVGFITMTEKPELIGLTEADVAPLRQLTNDLYVDEKWEWGSEEFLGAERQWMDQLEIVWGKVYDSGNIRVRDWSSLGGRFGGKRVVSLDAQMPTTPATVQRLQELVTAHKIPRADTYTTEFSSVRGRGGYFEFSYNDLMRARSFRDLKEFDAGDSLVFGDKAVLEATIVDQMMCCESHAFALWEPVLADLVTLDYITGDKAATASMAPPDWVYGVIQSVKPMALTGGDILPVLAYEIERRLPVRGFDIGGKAGQGLTTINRKIASLPGPMARQVRATAKRMEGTMAESRKRRFGLLTDIPDEVWEEAVARDELEAQPVMEA